MLSGGPPTPYRNLAYTNLKVQSQALISALVFHSENNSAVIDTTSTLTSRKAVLSKDYKNSKVQTFDLKSFYFGCKLASAQQGNGGPAQACTVQVTGYKQDPKIPSACEVVTVRLPMLLISWPFVWTSGLKC